MDTGLNDFVPEVKHVAVFVHNLYARAGKAGIRGKNSARWSLSCRRRT